MNADAQKRAAAARAIEFVRPGMRLGLGTGSTAKHFVELVGERVRAGLDIIAVPTSEATRADATRCGIRLTSLDETPELDLTVDGADEIAPDLSLIKGGGGALLREKIVASASRAWWSLPIRVNGSGVGSVSVTDRSDPVRLRSHATGVGKAIAAIQRPGPPGCGKAKTAMFSSRMAVTGSSTPRLTD